MAVSPPAFGSYTTGNATATQATGVTINKPANVANGDVLYAFVGCNLAASGARWACSGWTYVSPLELITTTGNDRTVDVLRKVITNAAGEPASYTFAATGAASSQIAGMIIRVTGANTTTPEDVTPTTSGAGSNSSVPDNVDITPATAGSLILALCFLSVSSVSTNPTGGAPANYTLIGAQSQPTSGTSTRSFVQAAYRANQPASLQSIGVWTTGNPDSTAENVTFAIAVRPGVYTCTGTGFSGNDGSGTKHPTAVVKDGTGTSGNDGSGVRTPPPGLSIYNQFNVKGTTAGGATNTLDLTGVNAPAGSRLIVLTGGDGAAATTHTMSGGGLSWSTPVQESTQPSCAAIHTALVGGTPLSNTTLTLTKNGTVASDTQIICLVVTGALTDQSTAANNKANNNVSSTVTCSVTTTAVNSLVVAIMSDYNASADTLTADTGRTLLTSQPHHTTNITTAGWQTTAKVGSPSSVSMAIYDSTTTALFVSGRWNIAVLEILEAPSGKAGTGASGNDGSGTDVAVQVESASVASGNDGSGTEVAVSVETGSVASGNDGSGVKGIGVAKAGTAASGNDGSGTKVVARTYTETATVASGNDASGTDLVVAVEATTAASGNDSSGTKVVALAETGSVASGNDGSGTDVVVTVETGSGSSGNDGSGVKATAGTYTKTGDAGSGNDGSGTDLVVTIETGDAASGNDGSGIKTTTGVYTKTGEVASGNDGSATDLVVYVESGDGVLDQVGSASDLAVHVKVGTGESGNDGSGTDVTDNIKTGTATSGNDGSGVRAAATHPTFVGNWESSWLITPTTAASVDITCSVGDVLIAYVVSENDTDTWASPPISSSPGLTWTIQQTVAFAGYTHLILATAVAAATAYTITASATGGSAVYGIGVTALSGTDGVGTGTAQAHGTSSASPYNSVNLTTAEANSAIVAVQADYAAVDGQGTWAQINGTDPAIDTYFRDTNGVYYALRSVHWLDAGAAGSKTLTNSTPTGQKWAIAGIEILPATPVGPQTYTKTGTGISGNEGSGIDVLPGHKTGLAVIGHDASGVDATVRVEAGTAAAGFIGRQAVAGGWPTIDSTGPRTVPTETYTGPTSFSSGTNYISNKIIDGGAITLSGTAVLYTNDCKWVGSGGNTLGVMTGPVGTFWYSDHDEFVGHWDVAVFGNNGSGGANQYGVGMTVDYARVHLLTGGSGAGCPDCVRLHPRMHFSECWFDYRGSSKVSGDHIDIVQMTTVGETAGNGSSTFTHCWMNSILDDMPNGEPTSSVMQIGDSGSSNYTDTIRFERCFFNGGSNSVRLYAGSGDQGLCDLQFVDNVWGGWNWDDQTPGSWVHGYSQGEMVDDLFAGGSCKTGPTIWVGNVTDQVPPTAVRSDLTTGKDGTAVSGNNGSGVSEYVPAAGVHTATGTGTSGNDGSGTDLVTYVETGAAAAGQAGSGTDTTTSIKTGGGAVGQDGSGISVFQPAGSYVKAGSGTTVLVGTGSDLTVTVESGDGALGMTATGTRAAQDHVKDGGATIGSLVTSDRLVVVVETGGAILVATATGIRFTELSDITRKLRTTRNVLRIDIGAPPTLTVDVAEHIPTTRLGLEVQEAAISVRLDVDPGPATSVIHIEV